jgi:Phosphoinositide 3-kinase C2
MPPKIQQQQGQGFVDPMKEKWVNVTWMPHTTLSQTSHVCLVIRSAHAIFDPFYDYNNMVSNNTFINNDDYDIDDDTGTQGEWKIRIGVYGISGLLLVPVFTHTSAAPVSSRRRQQYQPTKNTMSNKKYDDAEEDCENYNITEPTTTTTSNETGNSKNSTTTRWVTVLHATHDCYWDYSVQLPIRWRDLPRDSYIQFEIFGTDSTGTDDSILYYGTYPFFNEYGKLLTGLQKLNLQSQPLDSNVNYGLIPFENEHDDSSTNNRKEEKSSEEKELYDPVWNACCILDQIRRIEDRTARLSSTATGTTATTGNAGIGSSSGAGTAGSSTNAQHQQQQQLVPPSSTIQGYDVYGQIPAVPWLDTMLKERVEKIITDSSIECHTVSLFLFLN